VLTLISLNIQKIKPIRVHSGDPIAARPLYWRVAGALLLMFSVKPDRVGSVTMMLFENPESRDILGSIVVGFDVATAALIDSGRDSMQLPLNWHCFRTCICYRQCSKEDAAKLWIPQYESSEDIHMLTLT